MKHTFKYSLTKFFKKVVPQEKNWNKLAVLSMLGIIFPLSMYAAFLYHHNSIPHDAELRFSEISSNSSIVGSVIPASCQAYPVYGVSHHLAKWFTMFLNGPNNPATTWFVPGDTEGYCPGTEPAAGVCGGTWAQCSVGAAGDWDSSGSPWTWKCYGEYIGAQRGATSGVCTYYPPVVSPAVNIYFQ